MNLTVKFPVVTLTQLVEAAEEGARRVQMDSNEARRAGRNPLADKLQETADRHRRAAQQGRATIEGRA